MLYEVVLLYYLILYEAFSGISFLLLNDCNLYTF